MSSNVATRRYAQAIFDIGQSLGAEKREQIGKDLGILKEYLDVSPELASFFANPIFSEEEKQKVIDSLVAKGGIDETVKNFCLLLLEKGRLPNLGPIASVYRAMLDEEEGIVRSEVTTAVELSTARQAEIKSKLETQIGKKLALQFSVDPSIIGGLILKIDDKALDGSLKAQINILKGNIKRGE